MPVIGDLSAESLPFKDVTWKIPNFFDIPAEFYYVDSPAFFFANAGWCLRLCLNGSEEQSSVDYIDLLLIRMDSCIFEHRIYFKIGFKSNRGKEYENFATEFTFSDRNYEFGFSHYLKRSRHQNHLKVFCQMRAVKGTRLQAFSWVERPESSFLVSLREASCPKEFESSCQAELQEASSQTEVQETSSPTEKQETSSQTEKQETSSQTEVPESSSREEVHEISASVQKLQLDYKKLLQSGDERDVCLKVSDKEFRAHRCILRARSEVFNSMFKYETAEKASGVVVIDDLEPDSFPQFLQHLYAGKVEAFSRENVFNLYSAADKYDVQELKSESLEYMKHTLSEDTFCDVIALALRYHEEELLKLAVDFFSKNLSDIIVTVKWQIFMRDYHAEANELLIKALAPGKK